MSEQWNTSHAMLGRLQDELARNQRTHSGEGEPNDRTSRSGADEDGQDASTRPAGTGEGLDGRLRVTLTGGKVSDVHLDPRALRLPSEDLAAAIREAVNAAIDAHNEQATAGLPGVPPLTELSRTLDEVTDASRRAMAESAEAMREALAGVQRVSELHRRRAAG